MNVIERMDGALAQLARNWPKRAPKAFYLGPTDYDEFLATDPPYIDAVWNSRPSNEPAFRDVPVRCGKNVLPRRSTLYDNTSTGHAIPGSDALPTTVPKRLDTTDYEEIERVLDERSRARALTDRESELLEAAIKRQPISVRECARLGVKRLMRAYE